MSQKTRVIYENGILKPLEALTGISNRQILDITIENATQDSVIVQLGGKLRDHPVDHLEQTTEELRQGSWNHLIAEMYDG